MGIAERGRRCTGQSPGCRNRECGQSGRRRSVRRFRSPIFERKVASCFSGRPARRSRACPENCLRKSSAARRKPTDAARRDLGNCSGAMKREGGFFGRRSPRRPEVPPVLVKIWPRTERMTGC